MCEHQHYCYVLSGIGKKKKRHGQKLASRWHSLIAGLFYCVTDCILIQKWSSDAIKAFQFFIASIAFLVNAAFIPFWLTLTRRAWRWAGEEREDRVNGLLRVRGRERRLVRGSDFSGLEAVLIILRTVGEPWRGRRGGGPTLVQIEKTVHDSVVGHSPLLAMVIIRVLEGKKNCKLFSYLVSSLWFGLSSHQNTTYDSNSHELCHQYN